MTTDRTMGIEVTQADRDAAADTYRRFRYGNDRLQQNVLSGAMDADPLVQIFARHRQSSIASLTGDVGMRKALEPFARAYDKWEADQATGPTTVGPEQYVSLWHFRAAARAQPPEASTVPRDMLVEREAMHIFETWKIQPGWVPWVAGGNSFMQQKARDEARAIMPAASDPTPAAVRAESIMNAVLELPFANAAPIEWDDADWHHVRRALSALTTPPAKDDAGRLRKLDMDQHIFEWFNDRHCDEMRECIAAFNARAAITPQSDEGEERHERSE